MKLSAVNYRVFQNLRRCDCSVAAGSRSYKSKRLKKRLKDLILATEDTEFLEKRF